MYFHLKTMMHKPTRPDGRVELGGVCVLGISYDSFVGRSL